MKPRSPSLPESRVRGAIFGALVGDALGVPVEFSSRAERDAAPVTTMQGWGTWRQPAGTWSDDGALLLCTAEGLLDDFSMQKLGGLYVNWMRSGHWAAHGEVFDIGGATQSALRRIADGTPAESAGEGGEDQNGNGSLMRILPLALRFHDSSPDVIGRHAMLASTITHAHPRSAIACAFYCLTVVQLLHGAGPMGAYHTAIDQVSPLIDSFPKEKALFSRLLGGSLAEAPRSEIHSTGYVLHTLEAALWCLLQNTRFETTVLTAVNLGEDTDTTGCVAGGLAGAAWGVEAIPVKWLSTLPRRNELDTLIARFAQACGEPTLP